MIVSWSEEGRLAAAAPPKQFSCGKYRYKSFTKRHLFMCVAGQRQTAGAGISLPASNILVKTYLPGGIVQLNIVVWQ
ncbi:hypothetical protein [Rugamonas aquatica]|uniref:Uncharacterized protein n=1 Tax=Rugamonas aquatica TaxID=2743357 RepID=A0A6A7MUA3_9BURK|nr:hypothetical protein [Rugamonas aquatica]MQA36525.1 hypothetical protein [Rugamonas aquatica]